MLGAQLLSHPEFWLLVGLATLLFMLHSLVVKGFDSTEAWVPALAGRLFNHTELDFPLLSFIFPYSVFMEDLMVKNMGLGARLTKH